MERLSLATETLDDAMFEGEGDTGIYPRAEPDLLQYYLGDLTGLVASRLKGRSAARYPELGRMLQDLAQKDLATLP